jgi:hypothetical protein
MSHSLVHNQLLMDGRGLSRRKFITGIGAAAAGAALLAIGGRRLLNARLSKVPGEALARSMFAGRVGEIFQVRPEVSAPHPLRLAAVRDLAAAARNEAQTSADKQRSFSLLFSGPIDLMIEQGTYRFEHDRLGTFSLFIVPMAPGEDARYYEAIFNRQPA